ncbi:hypothetical protein NQZ68_002635 [Dissostichus eleginoides]|nr:hypothetical protein NQZ68_002635 [Dissostichus eleginoides]
MGSKKKSPRRRKTATFTAAPRMSVYTCSAGSAGRHLAADLRRRRTNKQEGHRHLDEGHTHNSPKAVYFTEDRGALFEVLKLKLHMDAIETRATRGD